METSLRSLKDIKKDHTLSIQRPEAMTAPIVLNEQGNNDHFYKNSDSDSIIPYGDEEEQSHHSFIHQRRRIRHTTLRNNREE